MDMPRSTMVTLTRAPKKWGSVPPPAQESHGSGSDGESANNYNNYNITAPHLFKTARKITV